jgi:hypothetical protein
MLLAEGSRMRTCFLVMLGVAAGCGTNDPEAVWGSNVTQLTIHEGGGGLGPVIHPTPDCPDEATEYTLVVANRSLGGFTCTPDATRTLVKQTVSRTLSTTEFDALVGKLETLRVITTDACGADKPEVKVTVTTRAETIKYGDSFYACDNNDHLPLIDTNTLDVALQAFGQAAFPAP